MASVSHRRLAVVKEVMGAHIVILLVLKVTTGKTARKPVVVRMGPLVTHTTANVLVLEDTKVPTVRKGALMVGMDLAVPKPADATKAHATTYQASASAHLDGLDHSVSKRVRKANMVPLADRNAAVKTEEVVTRKRELVSVQTGGPGQSAQTVALSVNGDLIAHDLVTVTMELDVIIFLESVNVRQDLLALSAWIYALTVNMV